MDCRIADSWIGRGKADSRQSHCTTISLPLISVRRQHGLRPIHGLAKEMLEGGLTVCLIGVEVVEQEGQNLDFACRTPSHHRARRPCAS